MPLIYDKTWLVGKKNKSMKVCLFRYTSIKGLLYSWFMLSHLIDAYIVFLGGRRSLHKSYLKLGRYMKKSYASEAILLRDLWIKEPLSLAFKFEYIDLVSNNISDKSWLQIRLIDDGSSEGSILVYNLAKEYSSTCDEVPTSYNWSWHSQRSTTVGKGMLKTYWVCISLLIRLWSCGWEGNKTSVALNGHML